MPLGHLISLKHGMALIMIRDRDQHSRVAAPGRDRKVVPAIYCLYRREASDEALGH
jgi:hypothetical protein